MDGMQQTGVPIGGGMQLPAGFGLIPPIRLDTTEHLAIARAFAKEFGSTFAAMRIDMSPQIDKIVPAIARAQKHMVSPRRNREVTVKSRRNNTTFTFRYSTLDVINDMIREPLGTEEIAIIGLPGMTSKGPTLTLRLLKEDQWIGGSLPLLVDPDSGVQGMGSALSYAQRYIIKTLLNISSDDDDDGNVAEGNDYVPTENAPGPVGAYQRLWKMARHIRVDDRSEVCSLLKLWLDRATVLEPMRHDPHQVGQWDQLIDLIYSALGKTFGQSYAWTFNSIVTAKSVADREAKNGIYHKDHFADVQRVKKETPQAYALLMEHIRLFSSLIDAEEKRKSDLADMASEVQNVELKATQPDPVGLLPAPPAQFYLLDWTGDIASDAFTEPMAFAKAFVQLYDATEESGRQALNEHNDDALAWVSDDPAAQAYLEEAFASAQLPEDDWANDPQLRQLDAVDVPRKANGVIDVLRYLQAIENSLCACCDQPTMRAWLHSNEPNYTVETFPIGTRAKILKAVMARKRALGMGAEDAS